MILSMSDLLEREIQRLGASLKCSDTLAGPILVSKQYINVKLITCKSTSVSNYK